MNRLSAEIINQMTEKEARETLRAMRDECKTCYQRAAMASTPEYFALVERSGTYKLEKISEN